MKKLLLFILLITFGVFTIAQNRVMPSKAHRNLIDKKVEPIKDVGNTQGTYIPGSKSVNILSEEDEIGTTIYDLQSNASSQNRMYVFEDGTIGAVWNMGFVSPAFGDRGTGYNYFDGDSWDSEPTARIEPYKTGWPSYMPYGENGELFVCHHMTLGLAYGIRDEKGTGDWTMGIQGGPATAADISWPRGITTGPSNNIIHFISVTYGPSGSYNDQYQALLYSRSSDGGQNWEIENQTFEELGPDHYANMGGDSYEFAEPKDGKLAFLVGDGWSDLVLMKSDDDGDSWEKTIIWQSPYPLYPNNADPPPYTTDGFYCPDGAHHLAFDQSGKVHVVFGINWAQALAEPVGTQTAGYYWRAGTGGIGYWNEDRPTFSADTNALSPYDEVGSELVENYSLIGWSQDLNFNDTIDLTEDIAPYYLGLSSMPQILIDDNNHMFVVYSSVTEGYENAAGLYNYRHLWARGSLNLGETWDTTFTDLTSGSIHIIDECVFPSVASYSDDKIYLVYQTDFEPGMAARPDPGTHSYMDNVIRFMEVDKVDILPTVGIKENNTSIFDDNVSQNYPNPFSGTSTVYVMLEESAKLGLNVHNLMGQLVYSIPEKKYNSGKVEFTIDGSQLDSGIYFYSIVSGQSSVTKKMIIE